MASKCDSCGETSAVLIECLDGQIRCMECCWIEGFDTEDGSYIEDSDDDLKDDEWPRNDEDK